MCEYVCMSVCMYVCACATKSSTEWRKLAELLFRNSMVELNTFNMNIYKLSTLKAGTCYYDRKATSYLLLHKHNLIILIIYTVYYNPI